MPSFKVEEVEAVDFDLRPYADAHGVVPEPTEGQINTLIKGLGAYLGEDLYNAEPPEDGESEDGESDSPTEREGLRRFQTMVEQRPAANKAVAECCSNVITEDQIAKLPFRVFIQFIFFLRDALIVPEAVSGDSTPPTAGESNPDTGSSVENSDSLSPTSTPSEAPSTSSSAVA